MRKMEKKYNVLGEVVPDDDVYAAFNKFIFSNDVRVIGKLLRTSANPLTTGSKTCGTRSYLVVA